MITIETLAAIADSVKTEVDKIQDLSSRGEEICLGADGTPTSQIDKVAENAVLMYLEKNDVPLNVLSEEIGFVDRGGEETLVLDPIDGSNNAIKGIPYYTVSLAVGKDTLSGMRLAYLQNLVTGDVYSAEVGKGAFKNGKKIHVREADIDELVVMNYIGPHANPDAYGISRKAKATRCFGCTSLEIAIVAEGNADVFYMHSKQYFRRERVVDIAAAILILREAGGEAYDLEGDVLDMPLDLEHRSNMVAVGKRYVFEYLLEGKRPDHSRKYGIYTNAKIPMAKELTQKVIDALGDHEYLVDTNVAELMGIPGVPLKEMDIDIAIVIGGDGTILRALQATDAPVLGINGGSVGFLAEVECEDVDNGIKRLLSGDYIIEYRMKLGALYNGEYLPDAVNEAVVHTASVAKIRQYNVYVDSVLACEMRSDGVMITTPTGSTSYAMSFGAPYIDPKVEALMVIPMAAYKSTTRAFVVPATSKVTVEAVLDKKCIIVMDGQGEIPMAGLTKVDFLVSAKKAKFVRFDSDFFSRVHEKLVNSL